MSEEKTNERHLWKMDESLLATRLAKLQSNLTIAVYVNLILTAVAVAMIWMK